MLSGRDIILISSIEWEFNWQGHQEIASRFARAGNRVLYVENIGVCSPGLHDVGRIARRFSHWAGSVFDGEVRQVSPGLYVCSPLILPPFGSPAPTESAFTAATCPERRPQSALRTGRHLDFSADRHGRDARAYAEQATGCGRLLLHNSIRKYRTSVVLVTIYFC